jgi:hypothetical protein
MEKFVGLIVAAVLFAAVIGKPLASPAPSFKIEDRALADAINAAQNAAKAGNFAEAITKAREADSFPNKPPALGPLLHGQIYAWIYSWALQSKDYTTAIAELDMMLAAGEGNREQIIELQKQLRSGSIPSPPCSKSGPRAVADGGILRFERACP